MYTVRYPRGWKPYSNVVKMLYIYIYIVLPEWIILKIIKIQQD